MEDSTAIESGAEIDKMFEENEDILIPDDMKRFLNEQVQHTLGPAASGVTGGRGEQIKILLAAYIIIESSHELYS